VGELPQRPLAWSGVGQPGDPLWRQSSDAELLARSHAAELPAGPTVYSFGTNDAAPWKQLSLEEFERNYTRLLGMCSDRIIVLGPSSVAEEAAWPRTNALQRRYSDIASGLTSHVGGTFIELFELLGGREEVLLDDGVHLNDAAYERITAVVLATLDTG
jgi:lysophospholipase L1-like esterase